MFWGGLMFWGDEYMHLSCFSLTIVPTHCYSLRARSAMVMMVLLMFMAPPLDPLPLEWLWCLLWCSSDLQTTSMKLVRCRFINKQYSHRTNVNNDLKLVAITITFLPIHTDLLNVWQIPLPREPPNRHGLACELVLGRSPTLSWMGVLCWKM